MHRKNKILIVINPEAKNGKCKNLWKKIEKDVLDRLEGEIEQIYSTADFYEMKNIISDYLSNEINCIISVGGDGTVNLIVNAIFHCETKKYSDLYLGAVGLGSSNDFIKPAKNFIKGIPIRLNFDEPVNCDVGFVRFIDSNTNRPEIKYFINNASVGVTAEANYFFNNGNSLIRWLKNTSVPLAIVYAAVSTIISFKNKRLAWHTDSSKGAEFVSNIALIKNPFVAGDFFYDQDIKPNDGLLGFNICHNMTKIEILKTLYDLKKGRFSNKPKRTSELVKEVLIETDDSIILETDGETFEGRNFTFGIEPNSLKLLNL